MSRDNISSASNAPALIITTIDLPAGGALGLTHCPGRCGGAYGTRDLMADLAAIEAWRADLLVSLVEAHEFTRLGVPTFVAQVQRRSFPWHHVPIPDFGAPNEATWASWRQVRPHIQAALANKGRIALHCAAGLGRTGTIAAKLLIETGITHTDAIALVRRLRPGTIETAAQMDFVVSGPRLFE